MQQDEEGVIIPDTHHPRKGQAHNEGEMSAEEFVMPASNGTDRPLKVNQLNDSYLNMLVIEQMVASHTAVARTHARTHTRTRKKQQKQK